MRVAGAVIALVLMSGCATGGSSGPAASPTATATMDPDIVPTDMSYALDHVVMREVPIGLGTACDAWNPKQSRVRTPPSYLVADISEAGVAKTSPAEKRLARVIARYEHSKTLRFARIGEEFIVFDAVNGPCTGAAPGYWVLNGSCNEFYQPSENGTHGVPGCPEAPRPWFPHERTNFTPP